MRPGGNTFLKYWVPAIAVMGFIFWMSTDTFSSARTLAVIGPIIEFFSPSVPDGELYEIHAAIRKLAHVTEYFVLGLVLFRAFRAGRSEKWIILRSAILSVLMVALYSFTDELHQSFVKGRGGPGSHGHRHRYNRRRAGPGCRHTHSEVISPRPACKGETGGPIGLR
ncbi:MAG: VanZ family protein [Nitrospiraceae bacterium]|nr:VanZ family protein [Nitrospiraceae bacterium]